MRLTLTRSGGFAGIRPPPIAHDTAQLAPADRAKWEQLVTQAGFFDLPETLASKAPQPDRFQYRLTIAAEDGREHTVEFAEDAASVGLTALVAALQALKK